MNKRLLATIILLFTAASMRADEIADWNGIMFHAAEVAGTSPIVMTRFAAIVQVAVFDAVNGIEGRYTPVHVPAAAPPGASQRAAAVMAAYGTLVNLYPAQKAYLDQQRESSLNSIASQPAAENSVSIARGMEWGQTVAASVWQWRSTDGFTPAPPPFLGGTAVGEWRPTPPAFASGAVPQFAYMTPWVLQSPSQFRPAGPPPLAGAEYAADFNESKLMGEATSLARTSDQTLFSLFWAASSSANYNWNQVALSLAAQRHLTFSEEARLLALMNVAIADAGIACWEAKYHFVFWRPVTAIPLADTDENPATTAEPGWSPLLITPAFPEYPSGHSSVSGAAATILSSYFGEHSSFVVPTDSPAPGLTGVVRRFSSFTAATDEVNNARVFGGIHFRTAVNDGRALGTAIANYVIQHALLPLNGNRVGQLAH
jgi:membrane-associated phospholipid phosphatase